MQESIDRARAAYLVETYSDLILRLSYTYLGSTHDAQDICQNVLLKLMTGGKQFESREHEKAFIIRTAVNACKDLLGSAWRKRTCSIDACVEMPAPNAEQDGLLDAVQRLPQKYREVVFLHYYEGYAVQEIAQLLGQREATVSTHLHRARQKLKDMLGGLGYEAV